MAVRDTWASGDAYEPFMGRWSRRVADRFIEWLAPPGRRTWLDVGCGTGALTQTILSKGDPSSVRGLDPSPVFVQHARDRTSDPRADFEVGDATSIRAEDASFDYVVSGLVLNFVPDAKKGLAEMQRVSAPSGEVATYVWDYAAGMQMLRFFWDAARGIDPDAAHLDEGRRFPMCRPEALEELWRQAGFARVNVEPIEVSTVFSDFEDYWNPFLGGQGPAPTYALGLSDEKSQRLREQLRERLPIDAEGQIPLSARAWAVRGTHE
jgi:SAM-dependent methyltransferase